MAPLWGSSKSESSKSRAQGLRPSKTEVEKKTSSKGKSKKPESSSSEDEFDSSDSSDPSNSSEEPNEPHKVGHGIPDTTFIFFVENLLPVYGQRSPKTNKHGNWDPPETTDSFRKFDRSIFRWRDGCIEPVDERDPVRAPGQRWFQHSVASVFPQAPEGQLLVVDVDVTRENVSGSRCGSWKALTFRHISKSSSRRSFYSYLDFAADHERTAARIENHCVTQLLPHIHNSTANKREHAGLIGKLALLIAIAALSGPSVRRNAVMRACIRPGTWRQHTQQLCGRNERWHGVVVSIFYDNATPNGSNELALDRIQSGISGAFYGP